MLRRLLLLSSQWTLLRGSSKIYKLLNNRCSLNKYSFITPPRIALLEVVETFSRVLTQHKYCIRRQQTHAKVSTMMRIWWTSSHSIHQPQICFLSPSQAIMHASNPKAICTSHRRITKQMHNFRESELKVSKEWHQPSSQLVRSSREIIWCL